ncbi:MAG: hypothetical protein U9Q66_03545, partial [Patescibacteria group bacterium]|nr:hypothetical protein [Patescibacteria group bacterium]
MTFESILHYEHENIKGHDLVTPLLKHRFKDDEQNLATFFNILSYSYLSQDDTYGFNLEGRANLKVSKSEYSAPIYLEKYSLDDINHAMLSMASIDLHNNYLSLSLGRNRVDLDWLHGSIDSLILFHENSIFSARAFWFLNYYDMQVNYTKSVESLNDNKGMYGLYLQSGEYFEQFELSLYYYLLQDMREMLGTQVKLYMSDTLSIHGSYTVSKDLLRAMD